jgi:hypothetical protein
MPLIFLIGFDSVMARPDRRVVTSRGRVLKHSVAAPKIADLPD